MTVINGPDPTDVVGRRVVAWILDGIVGYVASITLLYALGIPQALEREAERSATGAGSTFQAMDLLLTLLVISFVLFLLRVVLIGLYGWTLGKLMVGLRVVRYDGRPPGLGRAFVRSLVDGLGQGFLGCLYMLPALLFAMTTSGHRQPADMAANTYVIDAHYLGRLIMRHGDRVVAGPHAVHREELEQALAAEGAAPPVTLPANGMITDPFWDKGLDTHVVFSKKRNQWLRFDKRSGTWEPFEGQSTPG